MLKKYVFSRKGRKDQLFYPHRRSSFCHLNFLVSVVHFVHKEESPCSDHITFCSLLTVSNRINLASEINTYPECGCRIILTEFIFQRKQIIY